MTYPGHVSAAVDVLEQRQAAVGLHREDRDGVERMVMRIGVLRHGAGAADCRVDPLAAGVADDLGAAASRRVRPPRDGRW